jgi:twitching motility protein PilT
MEITELLAFTLKNNGSDLHLTSQEAPMIRINGALTPVNTPPIDSETARKMIYSVMTEEQRSEFESEKEIDFAIAFGKSARFRVNAFQTTTGPAAAFRSIPASIPSLAELNTPAIFRKFSELERGIVLVTGPTGSGKSTTLAAMINYINTTSSRHIITVEDPVEFIHQSDKCLVQHRELGVHTNSFARALKSALREDPDVILVGEMRDYETISLALTAAETGHLVMGTLHTTSAPKTIDRIIDVFPANEKDMVRAMLSSSIQAVIAQTLLPTIDVKGRCGAWEIMVGTPAVRSLIRDNKIPQLVSMIQMGTRFGMQTMADSVKELVSRGRVDAMELERFKVGDEHVDEEYKGISADGTRHSEQ